VAITVRKEGTVSAPKCVNSTAGRVCSAHHIHFDGAAESPTVSPTETPTVSPTKFPTVSPTVSPTPTPPFLIPYLRSKRDLFEQFVLRSEAGSRPSFLYGFDAFMHALQV